MPFRPLLKSRIPMEEKVISKQLIEILKKTLRDVPFLEMEGAQNPPVSASGTSPDLTLGVCCAKSRRVLLFVEIKKIGQPRLVREAISKLFRYTSGLPAAYGIVAAPYISPAAAQLCEQEGVGYIDLAGNCRLVFDTVYIVRNGTKNPFVLKRDLRSLYSPRGTRILRVMLSNPKVSWKTLPLARSAEVSMGQVANIKKLLKDREWIIGFGSIK